MGTNQAPYTKNLTLPTFLLVAGATYGQTARRCRFQLLGGLVMLRSGWYWKILIPSILFAVIIGMISCSDSSGSGGGDVDGSDADAEVDAGLIGALLRSKQELPLLPARQVGLPFNHSTEPNIAVFGDRVVVGYINLAKDSADSFETTRFDRRIAVAYSSDGGDSFTGPVDVGFGDTTSDPVVAVDEDGTFYLSTVDPNFMSLGRSGDGGATWELVAAFDGGDKEWLAVSGDGKRFFVGSVTGLWYFDENGGLQGRDDQIAGLCNSAFVTPDDVAYFALGGGRAGPLLLAKWNGSGSGEWVASELPMGRDEAWNDVAVSMGRLPSGALWIVRAIQISADPVVVWRILNLPGEEGTDVHLLDENVVSFLPVGATDDRGRLYVGWYETSGPQGEFKVTRSLTADWTEGFFDAVVVDPDACPGNGWYPRIQDGKSDRRLREYVGMAVSGTRAHVAWTHAPQAPARVWVASVDFPQ